MSKPVAKELPPVYGPGVIALPLVENNPEGAQGWEQGMCPECSALVWTHAIIKRVTATGAGRAACMKCMEKAKPG